MYAVVVPAGTTSVSLTPTVASPSRVTLQVNGATSTSGATSTLSFTNGTAIATIRVDAESGAFTVYSVVFTVSGTELYFKASNPGRVDLFGNAIAMSRDGTFLAIGAVWADGIGTDSGAVYVFALKAGVWSEQAVLTSSNLAAGDKFGTSSSTRARVGRKRRTSRLRTPSSVTPSATRSP